MFLSLKIENFRSIKDQAVMDFSVENPKNHMPEHVYIPNGSNIGGLKTIGFYGANASGKSNFLLAFEALRFIATKSGNLKDNQKIPCYEPYLLSPESKTAPTKFEAEFLISGTRYIYKVSFNQEEIIEEVLDFYPSRSKANIFTRGPTDTWETIKFGGHYKGGNRKIAFFANNTYLSKAGDNASTPQVVRDVFNYFYSGVSHISIDDRFSLLKSDKTPEVLGIISELMRYIDTGIESVTVEDVDFDIPPPLAASIPDSVREVILRDNKKKFKFAHLSEDGSVELFDESYESDGTRKLFDLAPLFFLAFRHHRVIVLDELDNNLHPHLADLIIRMFNDQNINKYGSQLIFSTHNIMLMSPNKLRRDQIFFVEKVDGKSKVYSLNDFDKAKVKSFTPFGAWYDDGRFGAVPKINYGKIANLLGGPKGVDQSKFDEIFGQNPDLDE